MRTGEKVKVLTIDDLTPLIGKRSLLMVMK